VAEVLDSVTHGGYTTVMLDTSFAAHMPDCLEMPYTPRIRNGRIYKPGENLQQGEKLVRLGGNSCLAGDWVGDYVVPKHFEIGERIVFEDMMHYTMVKTNMFNGIALPDLGIWNNTYRVQKRFSYENYKDRLS
jgi:carboxynorspermidine decarboxylase